LITQINCTDGRIKHPHEYRKSFELSAFCITATFSSLPLLMCESTLWSKRRAGGSFNESPRSHKLACVCTISDSQYSHRNWFLLNPHMSLNISN
jgi:hypothetical protein